MAFLKKLVAAKITASIENETDVCDLEWLDLRSRSSKR
jgi:hypothetical protein